MIIRQAILLTSFLGTFALYQGTLASRERITVFQAVYTHCILVLVILAYYCVGKFLFLSCRGPNLTARRTTNTLHRVSPLADMVAKVPRFTIQNVWILVYGLGLVFFITGYCFLGLHPVCLACAGLGIGVLSVDELVCPRNRLSVPYTSMRAASLFATLIALALVSADLFEAEVTEYITTLDLYSLFFGMALPFAAQFIMIVVRDNGHRNLGTVLEVCEFGFPFATFLGIFHLSVAYGQRFQLHFDLADEDYKKNETHGSDSWDPANIGLSSLFVVPNGPSLVFYFLGPLGLVPGVICYVTCILDGTAVDPLLSLTLTLCIEHLVFHPTSSLGIAGTVACAISYALRIGCEYDMPFKPRPGFQTESSQLPFYVVWGRERQRVREAEELTREFDPVRV